MVFRSVLSPSLGGEPAVCQGRGERSPLLPSLVPMCLCCDSFIARMRF